MLDDQTRNNLASVYAEAFMSDLIKIVSVKQVQDAVGDIQEKTVERLERCLVEALSTTEKNRAGFDRDVTVYSVILPMDTQVTTRDRYIYNDMVLNVVEVLANDSTSVTTETIAVRV